VIQNEWRWADLQIQRSATQLLVLSNKMSLQHSHQLGTPEIPQDLTSSECE